MSPMYFNFTSKSIFFPNYFTNKVIYERNHYLKGKEKKIFKLSELFWKTDENMHFPHSGRELHNDNCPTPHSKSSPCSKSNLVLETDLYRYTLTEFMYEVHARIKFVVLKSDWQVHSNLSSPFKRSILAFLSSISATSFSSSAQARSIS